MHSQFIFGISFNQSPIFSLSRTANIMNCSWTWLSPKTQTHRSQAPPDYCYILLTLQFKTEYCVSGWSLCTAPGVEALDIDPQIWVVGVRLMIPVFRCGNCKTRSPSVRITSRRARSSTSWLWVISTTTTPDTKRSPHSSSIPPHLTDKQFYFSGHDGCVRTLPAERGSETPDL